jgi:hypothetical protein
MIIWSPDEQSLQQGTLTSQQLRSVPDALTLPAYADSPRLHVLSPIACVDGRMFVKCACGWVREVFAVPPQTCFVEEAEAERAFAISRADQMVQDEIAQGERSAVAFRDALARERR